jgi:hypothetical protein
MTAGIAHRFNELRFMVCDFLVRSDNADLERLLGQ